MLSKNGPANVLVVFFKGNHDEFIPIFVENEAPGEIILLIKKGERIDADEELLGEQSGNHVVLKYPGIGAIFCEKSSLVFYWSAKNKKFIKVWTGD